jgi:uncharacterized protein (TIGR00369 family)
MRGEPVRGGFPDPGFGSLPGLERARAYVRGLIAQPPLSRLTGLQITQVGPGSATATLPASPWLLDPGDQIQPVVLMETALHLAALTAVPPGSDVSTTTLSVNYLRQTNLDSGTFVARARVVHSGRTYTLAETVVEDSAGRAVAQGSASLITRPLDPPPPALAAPLEPVAEPTYPAPDPYLRPAPTVHPVNVFELDDWFSFLVGMGTGDIPRTPGFQLFDLGFPDVNRGQVTGAIRATEWLCWRDGVISPGVLAYMALLTMHAAVATTAAAGANVALLNMTFSFLRPIAPDGRDVMARGTLTHASGDLFVATLDMTDADGNQVLVAHETAVWREPRRRTSEDQLRRELLTVLFTDIVSSTQRAEALGDGVWRELLAEHDAVVRKQVELFKGRPVKSTGDGLLATFDSPARAVQCARAIRSGLERLGLEMRAGLHTGECELVGGDVVGIAVHVAARLLALADPGELLVSATVPDLVAGSGLQFLDRGTHELKGMEGERQVFAVVG